MKKDKEVYTELIEICKMEKVEYSILFKKEMNTIFDLSYFLIDLQAIVNGLYEVISNCGEVSHEMIAEQVPVPYHKVEGITRLREDQERPKWQREAERVMLRELDYYTEEKVANVTGKKYVGYKQTTSRFFNNKYREVWKLRSFSKGSLILDITSSVICYFITEFLQALLKEKTGRNDIVNVNIYNNFIVIDKNKCQIIPNNSRVIVPNSFDGNRYNLDVKRLSNEILSSASPDEDVEESVRRFINVLHANGIVSESVIYDDRGIKTIVRDVNRMLGNFIDMRI